MALLNYQSRYGFEKLFNRIRIVYWWREPFVSYILIGENDSQYVFDWSAQLTTWLISQSC